MERRLIGRGLLAGAVAGILAFLFARIFAEPQIQKAIDYEAGRDAAQNALDRAAGIAVPPEAADPFSRTVQSWPGIGTGIVVFAIALGGLFAVAFIVAYGRVGRVRARALAMFVALGGFLTVYLVPFIKYPANPPAIGREGTIGQRGSLYLAMVVAAIVFGVLAVAFGRWLRTRRSYSTWNATLLAGAAFIVAIGVVMLALPPLGHLAANVREYGRQATETPLPLRDDDGNIVYPGFNADVLFLFRFYSVGAQLILWGTIGLVFAPLAERLLEPGPRPVSDAESTQSPQNVGAVASR